MPFPLSSRDTKVKKECTGTCPDCQKKAAQGPEESLEHPSAAAVWERLRRQIDEEFEVDVTAALDGGAEKDGCL